MLSSFPSGFPPTQSCTIALLADSLVAEKATWLHMADRWDLTGFFVAGVAYKVYAESSPMLDISTIETVLHTGAGLTSAGTRGWCCRVGKQRGCLNVF